MLAGTVLGPCSALLGDRYGDHARPRVVGVELADDGAVVHGVDIPDEKRARLLVVGDQDGVIVRFETVAKLGVAPVVCPDLGMGSYSSSWFRGDTFFRTAVFRVQGFKHGAQPTCLNRWALSSEGIAQQG